MRRNVWILSKWELFVEQPEPIPPFFEVGCYFVRRQAIPEQCLGLFDIGGSFQGAV